MVQEIMRHILELELLAALDESADPELGLAVLELEQLNLDELASPEVIEVDCSFGQSSTAQSQCPAG